MLPLFPKFKKLELSDKQAITKLTSNHEPYSDYNFVSLFCWDTDEEVRIASLNGNLVILFSDYLTKEKFYCFIGLELVDETIGTLIKRAQQEGINTTLKLIPESTVNCIKQPDKYLITEDRDSFDYILSVADLIELSGKQYHPQRNFIKRYKAAYEAETHVKLLELSDEQTKEQMIKLFYDWEKSRGKSRGETQRELNAIMKLIDNSHSLDLKTIGLFINNELKGFAINELVSDEHGVAHFEKVDVSHVGIFQYLKHQSALMFGEHGVKYMNIEQDLGIEGLRKTKLANHPSHFLKKYTISPT